MTNLRSSVARNKRPWGGKREGAGAPHRNLNALKHGAHSTYVQTLLQALAAHPATREVLLRLARRRRAEKRQAERTAALILSALLERSLLALRTCPEPGRRDNQDSEAAADTDRVLDAVLQRNDQDADTNAGDQSKSPLPLGESLP